MIKIAKYEETIEKLKPHLVDYLEEHGLSARNGRHFKCFNPNNHDTDGDDMSVHPDGHIFHCFGCQLTGNIMLAAHHLESKPINGRGYITDNVMYLCNKYGVPVELEELTDEDRYELDIYRAYSVAARIVSRFHENEVAVESITKRGWSLDFCRRHGIGTIQNYEAFREELKRQFPAKFVDEIDLNRRALFNENSLIFTVHDEGGRAVGFAARDLIWEERLAIWERNGRRGRKPPKYVNLTTSGTRNIYQKSTRLYGLHHYLRTRQTSEEPLYVFEGYSDWATAVFNGIDNSAALCGTAFTRSHIHLLKRQDVQHIVLCYDPDQAGQEAVRKLLLGKDGKDGLLSGVSGLRASVLQLPDQRDPDQFIREEGAGAFKELPLTDAFEWVLNQFPEGSDPVEICNKTIPIIAGEMNLVRREVLCQALSENTSISVDVIRAELERQLNVQEADLEQQKADIVKEALREATKHPESSNIILAEAQSRLEGLGDATTESSFSAEEALCALEALKAEQENREEGPSGFKFTKFKDWETHLNGPCRKDVLIVLGGKANTGKTAMMANIALDLSMSNRNDTLVIKHTIDDTRGMIINRMIAQLAYEEGDKYGIKVTMNKIDDPRFYMNRVNHAGEHDQLMSVRNNAFTRLRDLMRPDTGNLVIKDMSHGKTLAYAQMLVSYYRKRYPDKAIVYMLDNFHKLADWAHLEERARFKKMSAFVKQEIAQRFHVCAIATMEYTKLAPLVRPSNNNLAESVSMEYDANVIAHLYCELDEHTKAYGHTDKVKVFHGFENGIGHKEPTIEMIWGKNKVTSFKGSTWYDFDPAASLFIPVDEEVVRERTASDEDLAEFEWVGGNKIKKGDVDEEIPF